VLYKRALDVEEGDDSMQVTWLGWAGVELEYGGATLVIDPLADPRAVFARLPGGGGETPWPPVAAASPGRAVAGLVTHLHGDHADAAALTAALAPGAGVFEPPASTGDPFEAAGLALADAALTQAGLPRRRLEPWESTTVDTFTITALPAVDGAGDPQVSWLVEAGGVRVLHLGDTMFHGGWWSFARRHGPFDVVLLPVNGAVVNFPHRQPSSALPIVMDPEQAAEAAYLLGARLAVPIHAEGYEIDGLYAPIHGAADRFVRAAEALGIAVRALEVGEGIDVENPSGAGNSMAHGVNT